ncbi:hypothetical protein LDJ79_09405 [Vibrio tritonius]|uniref:Porin n=1 Tax=Vibrio tritonius TaxID=1435069 RepID=A0ABS7YPY9_9VIBR|nr:oligogalacturonate-specific porin KdgM family protein [Vibrio tritonius]MCA2016325.1 hypothetical protein [Vibrio tritonius]
MKFKIMSAASLLVLTSVQTYATDVVDDTVKGKTYLQYEHNYKTEKRSHGDSIKLVHKTPDRWGFEVKFGMYPKAIDSAYQNYYGGSAGFVLSKTYKLNKKASLTPQFEIDFQSDSLQYLGGAKISYKLTPEWNTYFRYRYQFRDYASTDSYKTTNVDIGGTSTPITYLAKGNIGTHRLESGISYRGIENWTLQYILLYDYSDYTNSPKSCNSDGCTSLDYAQFNNKKGYLYSKFKIQYQGIKTVIPYFEIDQKSVSSTSNKEQAALKLGFNWYF